MSTKRDAAAENAILRRFGELDREIGERCSRFELWWRDDDLRDFGPHLDGMLRASESLHVTPLLAAIPGAFEATDLAKSSLPPDWRFAQHGWKHVNHSPLGLPKSEFGANRSLADVATDLSRGRAVMRQMFGPRFIDIFVPPWNKFENCHSAALVDVGYHGFSGASKIHQRQVPQSLVRSDVQVDILSWNHDGPRPRSVDELGAQFGAACRRQAETGGGTIRIGILTHHRATVDEGWRLFADIVNASRKIFGARWLTPEEVFEAEQPAAQEAIRTVG